MKFRIIFFLILLILSGSVSCSKKVRASLASVSDYLPITTGSHWSYSGDIPETKKMTGNTKSFDGKIYHEVENTFKDGTTRGYIYKENGNYHSRGFLGSADDTLKLVILKDNVVAGTAWHQTLETPRMSIDYKFTIDKKNIEANVNGGVFEKVIVVKMEVGLILTGTLRPLATVYIYFAYGIGIIQSQTISNKGSSLYSKLESYEIK